MDGIMSDFVFSESGDGAVPLSSRSPSMDSEGDVGYQGWSAQRLVLAGQRTFIEADQRDPIAVSTDQRGAIYYALCSANTDEQPETYLSEAQNAAASQFNVFNDGLTDFYHVWTLAEAFLLSSSPLPSASLVKWLQMYCQSNENEQERENLNEVESQVLESKNQHDSTTLTREYWKAVQSTLLCGEWKRARAMLRCHDSYDSLSGEMGALIRQIENMPLLSREESTDATGIQSDGGNSEDGAVLDREEFTEKWIRWRRGCKATAASFGVAVGTGSNVGGMLGGGWAEEVKNVEEDRRELRLLWRIICGDRGSLEESTESWSSLFQAVLIFDRPEIRNQEVASVLMECACKHRPHKGEEFLIRVIRDVSTGSASAIVRFAEEQGKTLALSSCAAHFIDVLWRGKIQAVTKVQRSWFFRRLVNRLKASSCWDLVVPYVKAVISGSCGSEGDGVDVMDVIDECGGRREDGLDSRDESAERMRFLRQLAVSVIPESERATHELVAWCEVNEVGKETVRKVCRARGVAWLRKEGPSLGGAQDNGLVGGVPGACAKAAYWLGKGGGGVELESLCADISENLMLRVSPAKHGSDSHQEISRAALAEAGGVLAAIPSDVTGPEVAFLKRYKEIADLLMEEIESSSNRIGGELPGSSARTAGARAIDLLAPPTVPQTRDSALRVAVDTDAVTPLQRRSDLPVSPPPRSWGHLLWLAAPALHASANAASCRSGVSDDKSDPDMPIISISRIRVLMDKVERLAAGEYRVGSGAGGVSALSTESCAPYGFYFGQQILQEIRQALSLALSGAMKVDNAQGRPAAIAWGGPTPERRVGANMVESGEAIRGEEPEKRSKSSSPRDSDSDPTDDAKCDDDS